MIYIELIVFTIHARGGDREGFRIWQAHDL